MKEQHPNAYLPKKEEDVIVVHTDGSACLRSKDGGWAFLVYYGEKEALRYGFKNRGTVNEMELTAILRALQFIKPTTQPLVIYSDSQYAVKALTIWRYNWSRNGWRTSLGQPVKNAAVIREAGALLEHHKKKRSVEIKWIRGHAGKTYNEIVDVKAGEARRNKETNWEPPAHLPEEFVKMATYSCDRVVIPAGLKPRTRTERPKVQEVATLPGGLRWYAHHESSCVYVGKPGEFGDGLLVDIGPCISNTLREGIRLCSLYGIPTDYVTEQSIYTAHRKG